MVWVWVCIEGRLREVEASQCARSEASTPSLETLGSSRTRSHYDPDSMLIFHPQIKITASCSQISLSRHASGDRPLSVESERKRAKAAVVPFVTLIIGPMSPDDQI